MALAGRQTFSVRQSSDGGFGAGAPAAGGGPTQVMTAEALLMRQYLGSLDNPHLIVYCIRPVQVRYMQEWALAYYEVPLDAAGSPP